MLVHSGPGLSVSRPRLKRYEGIVGGKVQPGDVVVIRYEGPAAGRELKQMLAPTSALKGMGLDGKVALITDGRFSGGTASIDVHRARQSPKPLPPGRLHWWNPATSSKSTFPNTLSNVRLDRDELQRRAENWKARPPRYTTGCLGQICLNGPKPRMRVGFCDGNNPNL